MTRRIAVDDAVSLRLRAEMRDEESVNDVISRLLGERSWDEVVGIWPDADELNAAIGEGRQRSDARRDRVAEKLRE